jgi:hypothetical protein
MKILLGYIINTDGKLIPIFTDFIKVSQYRYTLTSKQLLNLIDMNISEKVVNKLFCKRKVIKEKL